MRSLRFGVVSEPVSGHLNPALTVGRALRGRGHDVAVFGIADVADAVQASGLEFVQIGSKEFPTGSLSQRWLAHPRGARALVHSIRLHTEETEVLCRDVPLLGLPLGLDALIVDQLHVCGPHLAAALGIPLVTMCAGPGMFEMGDGSFPPPYLDRSPTTSRLPRLVNRAGFRAMSVAAAPRLAVTNRHARGRGLPRVSGVRAASSALLQLSALVPAMNFGVRPPPDHPMRLVGPIVDKARPSIDFPWDRLDGRPLVYASLGTVQRGADELRSLIVSACRTTDVQLVLSHGGTDVPGPGMDGVIAVHEAPQLELLELASLCITHCGMNTTMECAANAVPMVGLPIVYDQPAVAARIRSAGVGMTVAASKATANDISSMIDEVLTDPSYRRNAQIVAAECRDAPGADGAAALIEGALAA